MKNFKKKRILFFCGNLTHFGGTEKALVNLANELVKRDYEIRIVSLCGEGEPSFETDRSISIDWLNSKTLKSDVIANLSKLNQICKSFKPDYWIDVDSILLCYSFLIGLTHKNISFISWEHFSYDMVFKINPLIRKITKYIALHTKRTFVVLSHEDQMYFEKKTSGRCKVINIPNPAKENIYNCSEKEKVVLAVGSLVDIKGFDRLLQIWSICEEKHEDWNLLIAGDGEKRDSLMELSQSLSLKNCRFLGLCQNLDIYFSKASVFAMTSHKEGFPMVCLEALSAGVPIVSFDISGGIRELITDGYNGYIVKDNNIEEYVRVLNNLCDDEKTLSEFRNNSLARAKFFSVDKIADRWDDIFI